MFHGRTPIVGNLEQLREASNDHGLKRQRGNGGGEWNLVHEHYANPEFSGLGRIPGLYWFHVEDGSAQL